MSASPTLETLTPSPAPGDRKSVLLALLRSRRGPARAITAHAMAETIYGHGSHSRTVRALIAELITQDGHGEILATTGGAAFAGTPPGYFWAETPAQVQSYYDTLVSRREELDHRMQAAWRAKQRLRAAPPDQAPLL